jgi:hypothetical protein
LAADRHAIAAGAPRHCEFRTIALTVMPGLSRPSTSFNHAAGSRSAGHLPAAHAEPRGWPGIGRSKERPFFDRLYPAMTENGMIING